ncbi:FtsX-like permease family protein [Blautia schinkii]|nr:FtsX-like permease family protein [Blautia schinkii]
MKKSSGKGNLQQAALYLKRKKGRTWILAGIFLTLCILVLAGITLTGAVEQSLLELRRQFYVCLTIERTFDESTVITPELTDTVVQAVQPEKWSGTNTVYLSTKELTPIPGKFTAEQDDAAHTTRIVACSESVLAREFTEKKLALVEGRHLEHEDKGKALISDELAEMNGLKLGDMISGTVTDDIVIKAKAGIGSTYEFEIAGIFHVDGEADNTSDKRAESEILANYVFVDEESGMDILKNIWQTEPQYTNGITLWVEDPALLDSAFEKVMNVPGYEWDNYFVNTNNADYDRSAGPLTQMEKILFIMLALVMVLGMLMLIIILTMWNHERTQEMGIFLSLGFSKARIMSRLITENLMVFAASFLVSVPFVFGGIRVLAGLLDIENAALGIGHILSVGAGGVLFCIFITAFSSIKIMRVNPKQILSMTS